MTPTRTAGTVILRALLLCAVPLMGAAPASAQTTLTLEAAMARARAESVEARALAAKTAEADARVQRAQSGFWPRVDLTETIQRGNHPVFVFSSLLAQRRFTAADFSLTALNHPDAVTNTRTAIGISQSLFDGGVTSLASSAAKLHAEQAVAARKSGEQDLALRAASAFVRVLQLEAALRATDAAVAAADSDRQRARARRDVGLVTDADVLAVDVHIANMRQRQISARGELSVARIRLAEATGLALTESLTLVRPALATMPAGADDDTLVGQALASHPLGLEADLQVQLADNARQAARVAWLPGIDLHGGWEFNGSRLGNQQSSWVAGAEIRFNLFRGFADSARTAEANHAHVRAMADRERVARRIEVDVRTALAELAAARAREEAGRAAFGQARESQRIIRDRYESGLATMTDVLVAAGAALDAESRALAAELDVILHNVVLDRALGRL